MVGLNIAHTLTQKAMPRFPKSERLRLQACSSAASVSPEMANGHSAYRTLNRRPAARAKPRTRAPALSDGLGLKLGKTSPHAFEVEMRQQILEPAATFTTDYDEHQGRADKDGRNDEEKQPPT